MANISVRKDQNGPTAPLAHPMEARWEPFRMMRDLLGWDPFREMATFAPAMPAAFNPSFEIKETKDGYLFRADVPGVKDKDLEVTITGNRLTISGKRDAEHREQSETVYVYERSFGSFTRSFALPEGTNKDAVQADLKDGVLTVTVGKAPEMQTKKIAVQPADKKS